MKVKSYSGCLSAFICFLVFSLSISNCGTREINITHSKEVLESRSHHDQPAIESHVSEIIKTESAEDVSNKYYGLGSIDLTPSEMSGHHYNNFMSEHSTERSTRIIGHEGDLSDLTANVIGIRIEDAAKPVSYDNGVSSILANSEVTIRLFGERFTQHTIIRFVTERLPRGSDCDDISSTKGFFLEKNEVTADSALAKIQLPRLNLGENEFYICVRENDIDMPWVHQGTDKWTVVVTYGRLLPMWAHILLLVILLMLSGLFSGLNLGLMAIDRTELKIIGNTGTEKERNYAKRIQPLRDNGNYLLCSLLLGNVMVNSTLTILLDDLTSGLIAVIGSTLGIVIFGEIIPQAFCSRFGLAVGAKTVWMTKITMAITFPLSYPVSIILDKILGEEIGNVYNRERLKELIKVTQSYNDLGNDEVNVIEGVLKLSQSTCADVMTKLEDVYMLNVNAILDFDTIREIMSSGYSRIPIYENYRENVVSILYTKDLAFVDPDDKMPLKTVCNFYHYPCNFVEDTKPLDEMFKEFKEGNKGHMAFVTKININDTSDPYYETIGLVTMEDVLEELIQAEINDETDILANNTNRHRSNDPMNIGTGIGKPRSDGVIVSSQMILATYQYLNASIDAFSSERISKNILERLLKQDVFYRIKLSARDDGSDPSAVIYERGKPADFFVLVLEGRVQAEMGKEKLVFDSGPFTFFGIECLSQNIGLGEIPSTPVISRQIGNVVTVANSESPSFATFTPDYTVKAVTDVTFLKIQRSIYVKAMQATMLERSYSTSDTHASTKAGDDFEDQIDEIQNGNREKLKRIIVGIHGSSSTEKGTDPSQKHSEGDKPNGFLGEIILSPKLLLTTSESDGAATISSPYKGTKNSKTYTAQKFLRSNGNHSYENKLRNEDDNLKASRNS